MAPERSRKERKRLEKIVLKRKLKVDRGKLLAELKKCQLQPDQMEILHSTSSMQTKGLKRFINDDNEPTARKLDNDIERTEKCLDAANLTRRRRKKVRKCSPSPPSSPASSSPPTSRSSSPPTPTREPSPDPAQEPAPSPHPSSPAKSIPEKTTEIQPAPTSNEPVPRQPAVYIQVNRDAQIEKSRLELPIIGEEQNIMESIRYNDIVVISGETGSGKTTQLPQFLYEAGFTIDGKMIGVTEPRRVAAVSMSERVANELNLSSREVSYQIRFSGNVSDKTCIKFMTDGVLLRECQQDFLLTKYSVIIIDEAHERSVFSDILIGLLSRIVPMRARRGDPLKLVIMSATLRVGDFTENTFLFRKPPPVINIEARQFPVSVHFAKRTPDHRSCIQAAFRKVCSVHSRMPKGGILVFVTSQMEVKILCRKLRETFPYKQSTKRQEITRQKSSVSETASESKHGQLKSSNDIIMNSLKLNARLESDEEDCANDEDGSSQRDLNFSPLDIDSESDEDGVMNSTDSPLHCLGLYAMLPMEKQQLVFKPPPEGTRLCVVATNVAETSITIPNVRYVIDTGLEKTKVYENGVSKFVTTWTSKSSAEQRKGRAGRMGPGQCYRLYSSAVYTNDLPDHAQPRILQKPVEDILLQMKAMNIDNVVNFPFPTRPPIESLMAAEKKLIMLDALDDSKNKRARPQDKSKTEYCSRPSALGRAMASFALSPRCSKMIVLSPANLLRHVICLVSAMTVREMFLEGKNFHNLRKKWASHGALRLLGDYMVMIRAVCVSESSACSNKQCLEVGLRTKAMLEIDKLRRQLTHDINNNLSYPCLGDENGLKKPSEVQAKILRQLLLSSLCDHVARRLPDGEIVKRDSNDPNKFEKKKLKNAYECMEVEGPVYISPESVLKGEHPEFVIYREIYRGEKEKIFMRDIAVIDTDWLPHYAHKFCSFGEQPAGTSSAPKYDKQLDQIICNRTATFGNLNWPLGSVDVPMHLVETGAEIYKQFASFLLSGDVIDWFAKYKSKLLSPPNIVTKPWSKLLPRISKVLMALINHNVKSKRDLISAWKKDPTYLKREYLAWLPENLHHKTSQDWDQFVANQ